MISFEFLRFANRVSFSRRRQGGSPKLTGRGGAPKFLKNWLTFARSPYDPDHILRIFDPPGAFRGRFSMARPFPPNTEKTWGH